MGNGDGDGDGGGRVARDDNVDARGGVDVDCPAPEVRADSPFCLAASFFFLLVALLEMGF